ncbi:MAG: SIMPL domain-containing protein [Muribaculaceae bacterium]|nr:SIMPL domain-containing protein [Muribaculaceae bacterium]
MRSGKIIAATVIALGLALLGLFIKSGFDNFTYKDRAVTVRGLAEREVKANRVTWPLVYQGNANDLQALYQDVQTNTAKIVSFLTENGVAPEEISVGAPEVTDNRGSYRSIPTPDFSVKCVVVVSSSNVDHVTELINRQSELMKMGVAVIAGNWDNRITYEYTDLNKIKPAMVAEATKNAREAANKFAEDSESKLGKIKTATQGQFSIEDRDQYTPYIKKVRVVSYITYYIQD